MSYGFNLGVISGLSRDIPVLNITLNNGTSNTYTLSYYDGVWSDDVEEPTIVLGVSEETNECLVILTALTSEDVGDEYTINLSAGEEPTQSFSNAVHMVVGSGGGGAFIVNATETPDTFHLILDKTWSEIKAASDNGQTIRIIQNIDDTYFNFHIVTGFAAETNNYMIYTISASGSGPYELIYSASSANDYPQADID